MSPVRRANCQVGYWDRHPLAPRINSPNFDRHMTRRPVEKAAGTTVAERYLRSLCDRTFLSMWSYPSVFRDQGQKSGGDGKEVCDLLVVFEDEVLIFSDKQCKFPRTGNLKLDWSRWFKRAVLNNAKQIWGAERWIRTFPGRLFLDRACTQPFPISLPAMDRARFHRIIVAHDASLRCREELRGSGSLMIVPDVVGSAHYIDGDFDVQPFTIGQLDTTRGFVHVLDDTSLHILMRELDTIQDFVAYLKKKERFISSGRLACAAGEEEILAEYLKKLNENGEHDFVFERDDVRVGIVEGFWDAFQSNPQRIAQVEANKTSYSWDALIERFSHHALAGTQYYTNQASVSGTERSLRYLARENRTRRRMLAEILIGMIEKYPGPMRATRVVLPSNPGDPHYAFLLMPRFHGVTDARYREVRYRMLEALCMVVKLKFPDAQDIVGIATETEPAITRSEDLMYFDARIWTAETAIEAQHMQTELGLLTNVTEFRGTAKEYPDVETTHSRRHTVSVGPNPRNKPCPCGSGLKYKKCHGR